MPGSPPGMNDHEKTPKAPHHFIATFSPLCKTCPAAIFPSAGKNLFKTSCEGGLVIKETTIIAAAETARINATGMVPPPTSSILLAKK